MSALISTFPPNSLEAECPGGIDWAWYGLGECIRTLRDKVSVAFGLMSIIAWLLFGFPQIVENCRSKIPDAAVSVFLLIFWFLGDSLNFIGAFLTDQLFMQKLLAGYTVVIDIILSGQYFYYLWKHKRIRDEYIINEEEENSDDDKKSDIFKEGKILASVLLGVSFLSVSALGLQIQPSVESQFPSSRQLLQSDDSNTLEDFLPTIGEKIGYAFGWISAIMYALGRCHQIYLNWRRKSTEGLSFYLFFLAVLGNTFYACQIFIKSIDVEFVLNSLPWILGSLGILLFDAFILVQFFMYRNNHPDEDLEKYGFDDDENNL